MPKMPYPGQHCVFWRWNGLQERSLPHPAIITRVNELDNPQSPLCLFVMTAAASLSVMDVPYGPGKREHWGWPNEEPEEVEVAVQDEAALATVYDDRNRVTMLALSMAVRLGYQVGTRPDPALHGEERRNWPVLFIDLPTGQVSWHVPRDMIEAANFPNFPMEWDGHTNEEKKNRILSFVEQSLAA